MDNTNEDVDFDFFDTPREIEKRSPKSMKSRESSKPPKSGTHTSKHGEVTKGIDNNDRGKSKNSRGERRTYDRRSSSESASDTDSETPRYRQKRNENKAVNCDSSESSSAYSDSDISSDDSDDDRNSRVKETIDIHMPKAHFEAWGEEGKNEDSSPRKKRRDRCSDSNGKHKSYETDSDSQSDDSPERHSNKGNKMQERVTSAKSRNGCHSDESKQGRKVKRSTSSSFSNNSDITDVSPLESPENSPRHARRSNSRNGKNDKVQYDNVPDGSADIKLETDQIDLSILMKCMADIDREKQQRLQNNSRRVMFASSTVEKQAKPNYTFSLGRAKMIEKENQRLLKQIMSQMNTGPSTLRQTPTKPRGPKKAFEPAIQRLTPSAVNRMREQRRIESENMHILNRLQTIRPTRGMSKNEQINEFERHMSYGVPTGTVLIPAADEDPQERKSRAHSSLSHASIQSQRSRPSSAGHYSTASTGRRSRPSSAKSNASVMSNASMRSNASKRSAASVRSNMSTASRRTAGKPDLRPPWDDRF